ncbi:MAG: hypothetical protein IT160_16880 [Bryobacterales bacterium]|nr:hypothetical protein [Bryobacterales bacterium]
MSKNGTASPIGLDIGTSRIVAASQSDGGYSFQSQLNAFVMLPYSRMTENVLKRENVPYSVRGAEIVVHGNESEKFAALRQVETRRPMTKGILNPGEPEGLNQIRQIITSLVGEKAAPGQKLCYSVPAAPLGADENLTYHEASLRQLLVQSGFEVKSINEGLAVVYAEMEDSNYTGIGISCGGGLCNVCLAYLSVPVITFSIAKAGDFIDESAASVTGELANRIRLTKEDGFHLNGHHTNKIHQVLGVYYDDVIQTLVNALKETFLAERNVPRLGRPVPLVLSGGTTLPGGFRDRFDKILKESNFPIELSEVRVSEDPLSTTAKGALIAALTDM